MGTTIVNPAPTNNSPSGNGIGFLIGALVLVLFIVLFFVYALPFIRGLGGTNGIQITIPKNIDVNVKQSK